MINLATCKRSELVEAYLALEAKLIELKKERNGKPYGRPEVVRAVGVSKQEEEKRLAADSTLRQANRGGNIRDKLNLD